MTAEQKCQVCKDLLTTQKEVLYMEEQIYAIKKDDMTILVKARSPKEAQEKVLESMGKVGAKQPTIEAEPVKRGKWEQVEHMVDCSLCGVSSFQTSNYCPNCGAKMDME